MSSNRRTSGLLIAAAVFALLIIVGVALGLPALRLAALQSDVVNAVMTEANAVTAQTLPGQPAGETIVSDVRVEGAWAFGFLVTRAPDPSLQIHAEPDLRLFITTRDEASGTVDAALEYTPEFYAKLDKVPAGLIPQAGLDILRNSSAVSRGEEAIGGLNFALPWQAGQTWTMTGGPHPDSGVGSTRPWSAVDLAYGPNVGTVRAAESGVVWRSSDCPNFVRVDHTGGYRTGYYHLVNEQVSNGQAVIRGDALGSEGMGVGCGGYTTGPHVHFSLRYFDTRINIGGNEFAGWQVIDGNSPYSGCMLRLRDNNQVCTPYASVTYEVGALPVIRDVRYDYNRDSRPDLWVVDLRPLDGGPTILNVYDGSGLSNALSIPRSSLPPQPVDLNTAFAAGDYNDDGTPDLWLFHRRYDTSGTTALRILDGANPGFLIEDTPTVLPPYSDDVRFALSDFNRDGVLDIYAIVPDYFTNTITINVADGANPLSQLALRTPSLGAPNQYADIAYALADYDADGKADLWLINPRDSATNSVSVKVLAGNGFTTPLADSATALPIQLTDPDRYNFIVTDYNRDGTPDLWLLNRKSGYLTVISGKNFSSVLYSAFTAASGIDNLRFQVLGSDRARLLIPPQASRLLGPADGTLVTDPSVTLRYSPSGLSKKITVKVTDPFGTLLATGKGPKNTSPACLQQSCAVDTSAIGLQLLDGQTIYWQVTARNSYGESVSATRSLTADLPGPVDILSPQDGQVLVSQPQFTWATRPTATRYVLFVRNKATLVRSKLTVESTGCTSMCAVTVGVPLENGDYWMRVKSRDAAGGISNSIKHHFTIDVPPATATPDGTSTVTPPPNNTAVSTPTGTPTPTPTNNPNATLPIPPTPAGFRSP